MPSFVPSAPNDPLETNHDHAAAAPPRSVLRKASGILAIVAGLVVLGVIALAVYRYVRPTPARASCCHVSLTAPVNAPTDHALAS